MKVEEVILFSPFAVVIIGMIYLLFFSSVFDTSYDKKQKLKNKLRKKTRQKRKRQLNAHHTKRN